MKIYLAGPCDTENRTIMVKAGNLLRKFYHEDVYCPWELKIENAWDYSQEEWARMVFDKDIEAINDCDIMIMISVGRKSTAGTNWEQGYAYALNKPIYVIQITNEPTSLMTFWGCTCFINTDALNIATALDAIVADRHGLLNTKWIYSRYCKSTLT